jgi:transcription antitermination factor NusG
MKEVAIDKSLSSTANYAADAVGVQFSEKNHWFIAVVKHGNEKICGKILTDLGYENYVPFQRELRKYANGRRKWVDRLVLTSKVFVRTTEEDRLKNVVTLPVIYRFMVDPSRRSNNMGHASAAIIPDKEMDAFRRMLEQDELPVTYQETGAIFLEGDKVRVIVGKLSGLEGTVIRTVEGKNRLYVSLDILGSASVEIESSWLKTIE